MELILEGKIRRLEAEVQRHSDALAATSRAMQNMAKHILALHDALIKQGVLPDDRT